MKLNFGGHLHYILPGLPWLLALNGPGIVRLLLPGLPWLLTLNCPGIVTLFIMYYLFFFINLDTLAKLVTST